MSFLRTLNERKNSVIATHDMSLLVAGLWFDLAAETSGSKEARKGDKEPLLVQLAAVPINRYLEVA